MQGHNPSLNLSIMEKKNAPVVEPTDTIESLNEVLDAADEVSPGRGEAKKKRQAVRKAFQSAGNALIMETAKLLGLVKNEWQLGEDNYMSIDMDKFDPKQTGTPEEVGLFLGLRDKWQAAGVNVNTLAYSLNGQVNSWGKATDRLEIKK